MRPLAFILAAGCVCAHARAARAQDTPAETARRLFDEGVAAASRRDYEAARRAFEASYATSPAAEALFAWAQAERLGGHCPQAVPLYRRFLQLAPKPEHAQAAEIGLKRCAEAAEAPPPAAPVVTAAAPPPAPVRRTDWLGAALVGAGTLGVGAGAVFLALSVHDENAAGKSGLRYDQYFSHMERARRERAVGITASAVGLALLGVGVGRFIVGRDSQVAVAYTGAAFSVRATF